MPRTGSWRAVAGFLLALAITITISGLMHKVWVARSQAPAPGPLAGAAVEGWGAQTQEMTKPPRVFFDNDGYYWIHYAQQMAKERSWRVRWTTLDNVPFGRPVHWSSGLCWMMIGLGTVESYLFGIPLPQAIEDASLYVDPLLLVLLLAGLTWSLWRRIGGGVAAIVTLTVASLPVVGWDFAYARPDHHGMHDFCALGAMLCLALGGAGWVAQEPKKRGKKGKIAPPTGPAGPLQAPLLDEARRWVIASGVFCGLGLWVGATQQTVVIGSMGLGLLAGLLFLPLASTSRLEPVLWRYWTISGVATGLFFYLVEYFPNHIAMRMEVNHPLYLLTLACGGEILHQIARLRVQTAGDSRARRRAMFIIAICLATAAILPAVILLGPVEWHALRDPYMRRIHDYIIEFEPMARLHKGKVFEEAFRYFGCLPLLLVLVAAMWRRMENQERGAVLLCLVPAMVLTGWTIYQARWAALADMALISLLVATLGSLWRLTANHSPTFKRVARVGALLIFAAPIWAVCLYDIVFYSHEAASPRVTAKLAESIAARDVALNLKRLSVLGPVRVMSAVGQTPTLQYFGDVQGTGSLYWENMRGVHDAADFFADYGDADARRIVKERGITHVVIEESPATAEVMHWTKYGRHGPDRDIERTLAFRLANPTGDPPDWLEPVAYYASPFARQFHIRLYRVLPERLEEMSERPTKANQVAPDDGGPQ